MGLYKQCYMQVNAIKAPVCMCCVCIVCMCCVCCYVCICVLVYVSYRVVFVVCASSDVHLVMCFSKLPHMHLFTGYANTCTCSLGMLTHALVHWVC